MLHLRQKGRQRIRTTRNSPANETTYAAHSAEQYGSAFDWADPAAIEAALSVNAAFHAQTAALARLYAALRVNRTTGRHALIRLLYFAEGHRLTQFEIASEMQVTSSNVTFLVDGLEKEGMVQRLPHPTDRRTVYVELTEAGEVLSRVLVPRMARFMAGMLDGFDDDEKRLLADLLERFRRNADAFDAAGEG